MFTHFHISKRLVFKDFHKLKLKDYHVENFCVDSEWANPEEKKRQLVKQFEADIRRDQVSDHPVGWAEVDMYLQRENSVRYIPDETERQVSQRSVLGHMTLGET